jgi:hypothetical protein
MLDFIDVLHTFQPRVFDDDLLLERTVLRDVNVLVDRGRHEESTVISIIGRQVGAASAKRNTKR